MEEREAFAALVRQVPGWLDRPIEDLVKMSAVGSVYVSTHRALLGKIKSGQLGLAEEDRRTKVAEGQAIGEALLDVERRIGELLPSAEEAQRLSGGSTYDTNRYKRPVSDKQAQSARAIASHPEAVAEVIQEAKDSEDIPTKTAVLNKIKLNKSEEARKKFEQNYPVYEAPCLDEFLEEAIEHVIQVNSVVRRFWDHPDQVDGERMMYFVQQVKRLVEIVSTRTEGMEWKQLS